MGIWELYIKYRAIIGGSRYKAEMIRCQCLYRLVYTFVVRFEHNGGFIEEKIYGESFIFPRKRKGKFFFVYYNEKYPGLVVRKALRGHALYFIVMGLAAFCL